MVSRRQFLFGAAAGAAALSVPQGLTGKIVSALLSPTPAGIPALPSLATLVLGGFNGTTLFWNITSMFQRSGQSLDFVPEGNKANDIIMWSRRRSEMMSYAFLDLRTYMKAAVTKDLEATQLEARAILMRESGGHSKRLALMDRFTSHETVVDHISQTFDQMIHELARFERISPPGTQHRPVSMDQLHIVMSRNAGLSLRNDAKTCNSGFLFDNHSSQMYSTCTLDHLKFLTEMDFLLENGYLARILTLPEREQSILDIFEANPASWAHLIKSQGSQPDSDKIIKRLNAAFPKQAKNHLIYQAALEKEKNRKDLPWGGSLPDISIPWNIVEQMQDQPDAFVPIMHAGIERDNQRILDRSRDRIRKECKGETTFTQAVLNETNVQNMQGILRGFFAVYPDKAGALKMLRSTFSAAVSLVADGDDILLEAKPEMNDQDRLLIADLSGVDIGQMAFLMPLKQPVPTQ